MPEDPVFEHRGLLYCQRCFADVVKPKQSEEATIHKAREAAKEWPNGAWCDICDDQIVEKRR